MLLSQSAGSYAWAPCSLGTDEGAMYVAAYAMYSPPWSTCAVGMHAHAQGTFGPVFVYGARFLEVGKRKP